MSASEQRLTALSSCKTVQQGPGGWDQVRDNVHFRNRCLKDRAANASCYDEPIHLGRVQNDWYGWRQRLERVRFLPTVHERHV